MLTARRYLGWGARLAGEACCGGDFFPQARVLVGSHGPRLSSESPFAPLSVCAQGSASPIVSSVLCVYSVPQSFPGDLHVTPDGNLESHPCLPGGTEGLPPPLGDSGLFPPFHQSPGSSIPVHCAASGHCQPQGPRSQGKGPDSSAREGRSPQHLTMEPFQDVSLS